MMTALASGVLLGLSAGLSPGPMLAQTLRHGAREGCKIARAPLVTQPSEANHERRYHNDCTGRPASAPRWRNSLALDMRKHGWRGRPLLVIQRQEAYFAWTGSHRIAAAMKAGLEAVPC